MRFRIMSILWVTLVSAMLFSGGCASEKVKKNPQKSINWTPVRVDTIPHLNAVELPLDSQMVSNRLLQEINVRHRLKLTPEVVKAFESNNSLGLLNPDNQYKQTTARQFSAYCTTDGKIVLIYNLVFIGYESCTYLKDKWKREVITDSKCTDIGVFNTSFKCQIEN